VVEVILAGYNVDREALEELVRKGAITTDDLNNFLTPETISAAYARISRDPAPVTELRKISRNEVEKARKSNQSIVFKMGHHSVAEHAVLNFDILRISRLATEALEAQRLCSYTEKSQRYITLNNDYVMPDELIKFEDDFKKAVELQTKAYKEVYAILKVYVQDNKNLFYLAEDIINLDEEQQARKFEREVREKKMAELLDEWAKEDARYVMSLATQGQLGFTTNARDLEKFIKYSAAHPLKEVQELGQKLYKAALPVIPSLLLFLEPNDYLKNSKKRLKEQVSDLLRANDELVVCAAEREIRLIHPDKEADNKLIAALIRSATNESFIKAYMIATRLKPEEKKELVKKTLEGIQQWDSVPREFEIPELTYEIIMSASCFAQFKRHRMLTLLPGAYEPDNLGYTIPPSIKQAGLIFEFMKIMGESEELYRKIKKEMPEVHASAEPAMPVASVEAADYVLTNAHNRRVLVKMNARELYHVSRFREDLHAQWDIRDKATKMVALAKEVMPLAMLLVGGKHEFQKIYNSVYNQQG